MATITTELVNQYFSEMNLRKPAFAYLDEFNSMPSVDDCGNTIVPVGTNAFEIVPIDYYKISVRDYLATHYQRDWKEFHKAVIECVI